MVDTVVLIRRGCVCVLAGLLVAKLAGANPAARAGPQPSLQLTVNSNIDQAATPPLDKGICATAYVDGKPNGICTLRAAIDNANNWPGGSTVITLPPLPPGASYTLALGSLIISQTVTILGGGASQTIIDGSGAATQDSLMLVQAGALTLNGVTVQHGAEGGMRNFGSLTVIRSTVTANQGPDGGGISNDHASLTVISSTVSDNQGNLGGGIYNEGFALVQDSTLSGNTAGEGGGLYNSLDGELTLINSTVSNNFAIGNGGGLTNSFVAMAMSLSNVTVAGNIAGSQLDRTAAGGGLNSVVSAQLQDTLLADNLASEFDPERSVYFLTADDCAGSPKSLDYNLLSWINSDCTYTATLHDHTNAPAHLGLLQNNGGPTRTRALLPGSPAIDAIPNGVNGCGTAFRFDQRGFPRPAFGVHSFACDIGAFELQQTLDLPLLFR